MNLEPPVFPSFLQVGGLPNIFFIVPSLLRRCSRVPYSQLPVFVY